MSGGYLQYSKAPAKRSFDQVLRISIPLADQPAPDKEMNLMAVITYACVAPSFQLNSYYPILGVIGAIRLERKIIDGHLLDDICVQRKSYEDNLFVLNKLEQEQRPELTEAELENFKVYYPVELEKYLESVDKLEDRISKLRAQISSILANLSSKEEDFKKIFLSHTPQEERDFFNPYFERRDMVLVMSKMKERYLRTSPEDAQRASNLLHTLQYVKGVPMDRHVTVIYYLFWARAFLEGNNNFDDGEMIGVLIRSLINTPLRMEAMNISANLHLYSSFGEVYQCLISRQQLIQQEEVRKGTIIAQYNALNNTTSGEHNKKNAGKKNNAKNDSEANHTTTDKNNNNNNKNNGNNKKINSNTKGKGSHREKIDKDTCIICKKKGHWSTECPDNPKNQQSKASSNTDTKTLNNGKKVDMDSNHATSDSDDNIFARVQSGEIPSSQGQISKDIENRIKAEIKKATPISISNKKESHYAVKCDLDNLLNNQQATEINHELEQLRSSVLFGDHNYVKHKPEGNMHSIDELFERTKPVNAKVNIVPTPVTPLRRAFVEEQNRYNNGLQQQQVHQYGSSYINTPSQLQPVRQQLFPGNESYRVPVANIMDTPIVRYSRPLVGTVVGQTTPNYSEQIRQPRPVRRITTEFDRIRAEFARQQSSNSAVGDSLVHPAQSNTTVLNGFQLESARGLPQTAAISPVQQRVQESIASLASSNAEPNKERISAQQSSTSVSVSNTVRAQSVGFTSPKLISNNQLSSIQTSKRVIVSNLAENYITSINPHQPAVVQSTNEYQQDDDTSNINLGNGIPDVGDILSGKRTVKEVSDGSVPPHHALVSSILSSKQTMTATNSSIVEDHQAINTFIDLLRKKRPLLASSVSEVSNTEKQVEDGPTIMTDELQEVEETLRITASPTNGDVQLQCDGIIDEEALKKLNDEALNRTIPDLSSYNNHNGDNITHKAVNRSNGTAQEKRVTRTATTKRVIPEGNHVEVRINNIPTHLMGIIDSGANHTFLKTCSGLSQYEEVTGDHESHIYLGGQYSKNVVGVGTLGIVGPVMVVPDLKRNLYSLSSMTERDIDFFFVKGKVYGFTTGVQHPVLLGSYHKDDRFFHLDALPTGEEDFLPTFDDVLQFARCRHTPEAYHVEELAPVFQEEIVSPTSSDNLYAQKDNDVSNLLVQGQFGPMKLTKKQFVLGGTQNRCTHDRNQLTKYQQMHYALNHCSLRTLINIAKHSTCIGLGCDLNEVLRCKPTACLGCWVGKSHKFPGKASFNASPTKPYQKLHYDIKGPFKTRSVNGFYYFLLVVDGFSQYMWIFLLKSKDDALQELEHFIKPNVDSVEVVASDSDQIFTSKAFQRWLLDRNIFFQYTAPYRHEGLVETCMRHVMDDLLVVLHTSHSSESWWGHFVEGVVYVRNRLPTSKHPTTTPFTLVRGFVPDISYIVPLGIPCVSVKYDELRKPGGLDVKGEEGKVVGFCEDTPGAYKVALKNNSKVVHRKDVRCDWNYFARNEASIPPSLLYQLERSLMSQPGEVETLTQVVARARDDLIAPMPFEEDMIDTITEDIKDDEVAGEEDDSNPSNHDDTKQEFDADDIEEDQSDPDDSREPPVRIEKQTKSDKHNQLLQPVRVSSRSNKGIHSRRGAFNVETVVMFQMPATPKTVEQALHPNNPYKYFWAMALDKEWVSVCMPDSFMEHPSIPEGSSTKAMTTMIVFRVTKRYVSETLGSYMLNVAADAINKLNSGELLSKDLSIDQVDAIMACFKFKARWVARGCSSIYGIHYDKTFSPTIHFRSWLILLHVQAVRGWVKTNIDVANAYINAIVKRFILILLPPSLTRGEKVVVRLVRNLYGTKDAGLLWYEMMNKFLTEEMGFIRCIHDICVYLKFDESTRTRLQAVIGLYVDDLQIGGDCEELVMKIKQRSEEKFGTITDMGQLASYLGIEIVDVPDHVQIAQTQMISDLKSNIIEAAPLEYKKRYGHQAVPTPLPPSFDPIRDGIGGPTEELQPILDRVGKLNYIANRSRQDIKFPCSVLSSKAAGATSQYVEALGRLENYLVLTKDIHLLLGGEDESIVLFGYADASFVKRSEGTLSQYGYCFFLGKDAGSVSSQSSKIKVTCTSSTEAEVRALHEAVKEVMWIRGLLAEMGLIQREPTVIYQDNISTITLCNSERAVSQSKHIMPLLSAIRQAIENKIIKLVHCPTEWMVADILTSQESKGELYKRLLNILMHGHKFLRDRYKNEGLSYAGSPIESMFVNEE